MIEPAHLDAGSAPGPYTALLRVLLALFVARVAGQILAATVEPRWLPPMKRWYSGVMPYRYLLPAQILIIWLMTEMTLQVARRAGTLGAPRASVGSWIVWLSFVYALGMFFRAWRRFRQPPERRGVVIPIVFHLVLAGFLFVFGSWHLAASA